MTINRILVTGGSGFIGTNLFEAIRARPDTTLANLDINSPKIDAHRDSWQLTDVRDGKGLNALLKSFRPDAVVHLAARTDLDGKQVRDYSSNTDGVARLLEALDATGFTGPAIFTSSMYVGRPG